MFNEVAEPDNNLASVLKLVGMGEKWVRQLEVAEPEWMIVPGRCTSTCLTSIIKSVNGDPGTQSQYQKKKLTIHRIKSMG